MEESIEREDLSDDELQGEDYQTRGSNDGEQPQDSSSRLRWDKNTSLSSSSWSSSSTKSSLSLNSDEREFLLSQMQREDDPELAELATLLLLGPDESTPTVPNASQAQHDAASELDAENAVDTDLMLQLIHLLQAMTPEQMRSTFSGIMTEDMEEGQFQMLQNIFSWLSSNEDFVKDIASKHSTIEAAMGAAVDAVEATITTDPTFFKNIASEDAATEQNIPPAAAAAAASTATTITTTAPNASETQDNGESGPRYHLSQIGADELVQVCRLVQAMTPEQMRAMFPFVTQGTDEGRYQLVRDAFFAACVAKNEGFLQDNAARHGVIEPAMESSVEFIEHMMAKNPNLFNDILSERYATEPTPAEVSLQKNQRFRAREGIAPNVANINKEGQYHNGYEEGESVVLFFLAAENWTLAELEKLLVKDPTLVHQHNPGRNLETALHLASFGDRTPTIELLLRYGAPIEARDGSGQTALHVAADLGCESSVRALLQAGADPNACVTQSPHVTALEYAIYSRHANIVQVLLETGTITQKTLDAALYKYSCYDVPCARMLLEHGANVHSTCPVNDWTIFHMACARGETDFVKLFLEYGADISLNVRGDTPLICAVCHHRYEVVEVLQNSTQYKEEMLNADMLRLLAESSSADRCHACLRDLSNSYYECLSCAQKKIRRRFCCYCVLDSKQMANKYCPNHVFVRHGQLPFSGKRLRGAHGSVEVENAIDTRCRLWLSAKVEPGDCLGLYMSAKNLLQASLLSKDSCDTEPLLAVLASEIPTFFNVYSRLTSHDTTAIVSQLEEELEKLLPGWKRHIMDVSFWLISRAMRPRDGLPAWMALVGCASTVAPYNLCHLLGQISSIKLRPVFDLFPRLVTMKKRLSRQTEDLQPVLTKIFVGDFPVAVISVAELFRRDRMPEHGQCQWDKANELPSGPSLKLFVSHAWRGASHPDEDGTDWVALREFFFFATHRAIVLFINLLAMGFSSHAIAEDPFLDPAMETETLAWAKLVGHAGFSVQLEGSPSLEGSATVAVNYEPLLARLLEIVCFCRGSDAGFPVNEDISALFQAILDRTFLWIDFVSLPQKVSRPRSPRQDEWFHASLDRMGSIQQTMLSILFKPTERYFSRAWCVAEYINTKQEYSVARVDNTMSFPNNEPDMDAWLRAMLGPEVGTAEELIQHMGLRITNNADEDTVCGIVWSRVASYLQKTATAGITGSSKMSMDLTPKMFPVRRKFRSFWVVAEGRAKVVADYFLAMGTEAFLDYRHGWLAWRKLLRQEPNELRDDDDTIRPILFLVDSCVNARPHALLPSLQSLAVFIAGQIDEEALIEVILVSDYTEESIVEMKQANPDALVVALPTSVFADQAEYVLLHPSCMDFEEVPEHVVLGSQCVVS